MLLVQDWYKLNYIYWCRSLVYLDVILRIDAISQALNRAHQIGTMLHQDL